MRWLPVGVASLCVLLFASTADALVRNNLLRFARWAGGYRCLWRDDPVAKLDELLQNNIAGQDEATSGLMRAVRNWQRDMNERRAPLILVFVGPTGAGKTRTAELLAEAMFAYTHAESEHVMVPEGQLLLDGATYNSDSDMPASELRTRLALHLRRCQGRGMVVVDEITKARSDVLTALRPLIAGSTSLSSSDGDSPVVGSAHRSIVVLTADLLHEELEALMLAAAEHDADGQFEVEVDGQTHPRAPALSRTSITRVKAALRDSIRKQFADTWRPLGLSGAAVVIPFLPFTEVAMEQVVSLRLGSLERGVADRTVSCAVGNITFDRRLVELWAGPHFVDYGVHVGSGDDAAAIQLSEYGARPVWQPSSPASVVMETLDSLVEEKFGQRASRQMRTVLRARVEPDPAGSETSAMVTVELMQRTADGTLRWENTMRQVISALVQ